MQEKDITQENHIKLFYFIIQVVERNMWLHTRGNCRAGGELGKSTFARN